METIEVKCPKCGRLLLKVTGLAKVETRCRHCKIMVVWPTLVSTTGSEGTTIVARINPRE